MKPGANPPNERSRDDPRDKHRDDHLAAALRHAPDHDAQPPSALDARILASARAAAHATTPARPGWAAWLNLFKPAPAAAFATLVLGTMIGLMWHGQTPPELLPSTDVVQPATPPAPAAVAKAEPARSAQDSAVALAPTPTPTPPPTPSPAAKVRPAAPPLTPAAPPAQTVPVVMAQAPAAPAPALRERADSAPAPAAVAAVPAAAAAPTPILASESRAEAAPALAEAKKAAAPLSATSTRRALADAAGAASSSEVLAATLPATRNAPQWAAIARTAQGPWLPVDAASMPAGGSELRDREGLLLGRVVIDEQWVWWQPATPGATPLRSARAPRTPKE
jgi:hypothetical protein